MSNAAYPEFQKLEVDAIVELFTLDVTNLGGTTYYFHNYQVAGDGKIIFDSIEYLSLPIKITGIEVTGTGTKPHPKLVVSNVMALLSTLVSTHDDLIGAKVTRTRTLKKFLDGEPAADPAAIFPLEIFFVEQRESETPAELVFALVDPTELAGVKLPRRIMLAGPCMSLFRSDECGWVGGQVYEQNGDAIPASFQGGWVDDTTYAINETVLYWVDKKVWLSKQNTNLNNTPTAGAWWEEYYTDTGEWSDATTYTSIREVCYLISTDGIKHYFVVKAGSLDKRPPNATYWTVNECPKKESSCTNYWGALIGDPGIPYGAFPGISKLPRIF